MLTRIKDKISSVAQRALGIDDMRFKLNVITNKVDAITNKLDAITNKLDAITNKLDVITDKFDQRLDPMSWQIRQVSEGLDRLKSFLTWSANRVEPWLPAESFSQTEPDYDLAGFLYNFLPGRVAVDVGAKDSEFAKALSGIGYKVFCFPSTAETFEKLRNETVRLPRVEVFDFVIEATETLVENAKTNGGPMHPSGHRGDMPGSHLRAITIASLVSCGILPMQIDLLKIGTGHTDLEVAKGLASTRPAVVQIEFFSEDLTKQRDDQMPVLSASEKIKAMRDLEYYWNIIIFRVDSEDFVRMAANLGGIPKQSWGKIFFFQNYQLFLKAHHWCKGALPRFRAAALPRR